MKKIYVLVILVAAINISAQTAEEIKTSSTLLNTAGLISFNNKLIFGANTVLNISDGTDAATKPLTTSSIGFIFGKEADGYAHAYNGKLYFVASSGADGKQLWVTDGTEAGTQVFKKFTPANNVGVNLKYFVEYNSKLYFLLDDKISGLELWSTDGTNAGTVLVKDINPGGNGFDYTTTNNPANPSFTIMNNKLYFKANDGSHGLELWVTDGTSAGTQMVKDVNTSSTVGGFNGKSSGRLGLFCAYNNNLYFASNDGVGSGYDLWLSDGTAAGTKQFLSKDGTTFLWANNFTVFNSKLYFYGSANIQVSTNNWVVEAGLWCTDGTVAGTAFIKSFNTINGDNGLSDDTRMGSMRIFNGKLYFAAAEPKDSQIHFWVSDGTTAGTVLVSKINTSGTSFPNATVSSQTFVSNVFNNKLFFVADDGKGFDLFSTDGSASGIVKVNSPAHTFTQQLINTQELKICNGSLYFSANYTGKSDLWRIKGNSTDVEEISDKLPAEFSLSQNYPNPFNPETTISYTIPSNVKSETVNVTLKVFDVLGREVATLVKEFKQAGNYVETLRATSLPSGIYFYRLQAGNFSLTKKMVLTK